MQLAILVVQNHHAGTQKSHWDKKNKGNYYFKLCMPLILLVSLQCDFCVLAWWLCTTRMASRKGPIIPNDFCCLCYLYSNITLRRYYTKEQFYRQAVQYADKAVGVDKTIIVFSAPYRAHGKKTDTIVRWECTKRF